MAHESPSDGTAQVDPAQLDLLNVDTSEMARHLGMSSQGLHWYESQDLISPQKVNARRKYTTDDLCILSRIRFYRQAGYALEEISRLLDMDLTAIADSMDERARAMQHQLAVEQEKFNIFVEKAELTRLFPRVENQLSLVVTEPFYFLHSLKYGEVRQKALSSSNHWVNDMPLTQFVSIARYAPEERSRPSKVGMALPVKYLSLANDAIRADIASGKAHLIDSRKAYYGLFTFAATENFVGFGEILDQLDDFDAELADGTMIWRPITCHRDEAGIKTYWEIWLTLKESAHVTGC
jgi:DNA-binding transcriptional MerR regulator